MVTERQIRERLGDDLTNQEVSLLQKILEGVDEMSDEEYSKEYYKGSRDIIELIVKEIKTEHMYRERARAGLRAILFFIKEYEGGVGDIRGNIKPYEQEYLDELKERYNDCKKYVMERFNLSGEEAILSDEEFDK